VRVLFPARGSNVVGRLVMQKLSESLGQQFIIDNRAAHRLIGADVVAKAAPDGYSIMVHRRPMSATLSTAEIANDTLRTLPVSAALRPARVLTVHPRCR
jgi:tripartite-type tricarboxylate transporter receptor subunit TctC